MRSRTALLTADELSRPYERTRPIEVVELELDDPGPGELLVRVDAAGLCHSDLSVVDGNRPRPLPMALGHEAAGTVVGRGSGVRDVEEGDRVVLVFVPRCGNCRMCASGRPALCEPAAVTNASGELLRGGRRWGEHEGRTVHHHLGVSAFSEHVVVDRGSVVVVPSELPPETAALFGCALLTGAGAVLETARVRPGESVAVFGLGGVGQCAVMGAALAGANPIVAVDPVPAKRELALELGATHALPPEGIAETLRETVPGGVEHAIEAVGSGAVLADAWAVTARGGSTVAVGLPHPTQRLEVPVVELVGQARRLLGSYVGDSVPDRDIPRYVELWRAGRLPLERLRSSQFELGGMNAALDALADGEALRQVLRPHGLDP
jgi:alcohol dehydrogenase